MRRRGTVLLLAWLAGCGGDGTVNNDTPILAATVRAARRAGPEPDQGADAPSLSADGRYVAFSSLSTTFSDEDGDAVIDVFVQDLWTREVVLASRAAGPAGAPADGHCYAPSLSADGRRVAFLSTATNLHPDDPDAYPDICVRDLATGALFLASRGTADLGIKDVLGSLAPAISGDGRRVAFHAYSRFDPDDPDTARDVYVRDLDAAVTILASRATGLAGAKGDSASLDASMSHDGTRVAFVSEAGNFTTEAVTWRNIFVRDLAAGDTLFASRADGPLGAGADQPCHQPFLSGDGRVVCFGTQSSNLDPDDPDGFVDLYVRDLSAATTRLVHRAAGPNGIKGNADARAGASLSFDGRRIAFASNASNLIPQDGNFTIDVFVRDLPTDTLMRVSVRTFGAECNGGAETTCLSADGRFVAFVSYADNLVDDDGNQAPDVFIRGPLQ